MIRGTYTPAISFWISFFILIIILGFINIPKGNAQYNLYNYASSPSPLSIATVPNISLFNSPDKSYYYPPKTLSFQLIEALLNGLYIPQNLSVLNPAFSQNGYNFSLVNKNNILSPLVSNWASPADLYITRARHTTNISPLINSGNYFSNSIFSPLTSFFTSPQVQPYAVINGNQIRWLNARSGVRGINSVASLVLANAAKGMNCWDPAGWLEAGFQVNIWTRDLPVRAQSLDEQGHILDAIPTYTIQQTGQTGSMTLLRSDILLYEGMFNAEAPNDYQAVVNVDTISATAIIHRKSAACDACHPAPPGHIAASFTWGICHNCHKLDNVMHVHAYRANIPIDDCYRCHPTGCLSGVHGQIGIWCTNCHGNLADAMNNRMKISGQLGLPHCADCHDPVHSENLPDLYINSAGHGRVWCINCHGPTHKESIKAFGYSPFGYNSCEVCHKVQASVSWMGPNCGVCHGSSTSPHLVTR